MSSSKEKKGGSSVVASGAIRYIYVYIRHIHIQIAVYELAFTAMGSVSG